MNLKTVNLKYLLRAPLWLVIAVPILASIGLFGTDIFLPNSTFWLWRGDTGMNYVSWVYYQHANVIQFPVTGNFNYGMFYWSNIAYSDSIPLFGILFNSLNLLPLGQHYFGLWILTCMVLQYYFAYVLLKQFSSDKLSALVFAINFLLASVFLARSGVLDHKTSHLALMGHWIILASLVIYFKNNLSFVPWLVVVFLSAFIHVYLTVFVLSILCALVVKKSLQQPFKRVFFNLALLVLMTIACLFFFWVQGYFIGNVDHATGGFGRYRANLASFIDSNGKWSTFLSDLPDKSRGDYEGAAYLGLGIITGLFYCAYHYRPGSKKIWSLLRAEPIYIMAIIMFIVSISNKVGIFHIDLFAYPLPNLVDHVANIFRSSGRFIWLPFYLILLYCFIALSKIATTTFNVRILIIGVTLIQLADLTMPLAKIHAHSRSSNPAFSKYDEEFVKHIAMHKKAYVISDSFEAPNLNDFAILTALANVPITQARLGRRDRSISMARHKQIQNDIKQNGFSTENIYFFEDRDEWKASKNHHENPSNFQHKYEFYFWSSQGKKNTN